MHPRTEIGLKMPFPLNKEPRAELLKREAVDETKLQTSSFYPIARPNPHEVAASGS